MHFHEQSFFSTDPYFPELLALFEAAWKEEEQAVLVASERLQSRLIHQNNASSAEVPKPDFPGIAYKVLRPGLTWDQKWIRSEEHTSELQSRGHLVCRLLRDKQNS